MRALKIAGAALAAVIVVVVLLLVIGIPSGFLTSQIQDRVETATGYRLTIAGTTKIGLWPTLNVTLNDVTLQDPKERDANNRVTVGSVQADMTLASVWSGHPKITELVITRAVISVPLRRERDRSAASAPSAKPAAASSGATDANTFAIDHVKVSDGTIVLSNLRDRVENRIEGISADAKISSDRRIDVTGSARTGEHPLKFSLHATAPAFPVERQNIPVELTLDAVGLLDAPLSAKAAVRLNGSVAMINGVTGALGDSAFNGWASVDLSSKPLVKVDLDFQKLDVGMPKTAAAPAAKGAQASDASNAGPQSWSNATINVSGLNYVDAQIRISAAELNIGDAHFAPAAIDAALADGAAEMHLRQSRPLWRHSQRRA